MSPVPSYAFLKGCVEEMDFFHRGPLDEGVAGQQTVQGSGSSFLSPDD